jgi:hypothetical protein
MHCSKPAKLGSRDVVPGFPFASENLVEFEVITRPARKRRVAKTGPGRASEGEIVLQKVEEHQGPLHEKRLVKGMVLR